MRSVFVLACLARVALAQPSTPTPPSPTPDSEPASGSDATAGPDVTEPPPVPTPTAPPPATPPVGFGLGPKNATETAATVEARHEAEAVCAAHDPKCDWVATFSSLERRSIIRTLLRRGLDVEPVPWGKVIE